MQSDFTSVILMSLVTCSAFVGAVNSRGTVKMVVSYLLAFFCLSVTAFYLTQTAMSASDHLQDRITGEAEKVLQEKMDVIEQLEESMREKEASQEQLDAYKQAVSGAVGGLAELNSKIRGLRIRPNSDEEYERFKGRAGYYVGEADKYLDTLKAVKPPEELAMLHGKILKAAQHQLTACAKLRHYYLAENAEEEAALERSFRNFSSQAAALIGEVQGALH